MLHRVLPWLWRLADEDEGRPELPWELQQQLLEALHCCPVAEDPQVSIWWATSLLACSPVLCTADGDACWQWFSCSGFVTTCVCNVIAGLVMLVLLLLDGSSGSSCLQG
jgi:hypothetical protein